MNTYDIRRLQLRILDVFLIFDSVCKEHNLRYYLIAGTLLGAVRHKGFIPWDDDLDVGMPRADYELLIANSKDWLPKQYEFICAENNPKYPFPFGKVQDANTTLIERRGFHYVGGVYMDIFPIDGVPEGKMAQKIHFAKYSFWTKVLYFTCRDPKKHKKGISSWVPAICRKLFTVAKVQQSIRSILTYYDFDVSSYVAEYDDRPKWSMDKRRIGAPRPILFEGHEVCGPEDPDFYLKQKYGNYMQIPKQQDQIQHDFMYLDFDKSYKEYRDF